MDKLISKFESLSDSEKRVCQYMLSNVKRVVNMTVNEVADSALVSKTIVINTSQELGFDGFTDLKYYLKQQIARETEKNRQSKDSVDFNEEMKDVVGMTCALVGQRELQTVCDLITQSSTVYVAARGTSKSVAQYLNHMLITIGIKSVLIDDYNLLSLIAERIERRELMILISLSGETKKIVDAARKVKARDAHLVGVTSFTRNSLSKLSDITIYSSTTDVDTADDDSHSRMGQFVNVEMICNQVKSKLNI